MGPVKIGPLLVLMLDAVSACGGSDDPGVPTANGDAATRRSQEAAAAVARVDWMKSWRTNADRSDSKFKDANQTCQQQAGINVGAGGQ